MIQTVDLWYWKQNALPTEPQPLPGVNVYLKNLLNRFNFLSSFGVLSIVTPY